MLSCSKSDFYDLKNDNLINALEVNNTQNYFFEELSEEEQLKVTISEALERIFTKDERFAKDFIQSYLLKDGKVIAFLYQESKKTKLTSKSLKNEKSLEELLIENVKNSQLSKNVKPSEIFQKKVSLIRNATDILPNLVIKIPDWANIVIDEFGVENL